MYNKHDVPYYLRISELYKNIDSDEPFKFQMNIIIKTVDDLNRYIRILDYWMIKRVPIEMYEIQIIIDYIVEF